MLDYFYLLSPCTNQVADLLRLPILIKSPWANPTYESTPTPQSIIDVLDPADDQVEGNIAIPYPVVPNAP